MLKFHVTIERAVSVVFLGFYLIQASIHFTASFPWKIFLGNKYSTLSMSVSSFSLILSVK